MESQAATHPSRKLTSASVAVLSGSLSAPLVQVLMQPLDVLKTRMIGRDKFSGIESPLESMKQIIKSDGYAGLYRGSVPTLMRVTLGSAINFGVINALSNSLKHTDMSGTERELSHMENFFVGAFGRSAATVLICPITVVKTRFEFEKTQQGVIRTMMQIKKAEGFRGLFSGISASIARDAPYSGLFYLVYAKSKLLLAKHAPESSKDSPRITLPAGFFAGTVACAATHPFDVVRTRFQLQSGIYNSLPHALISMYKREGLRSLFRGLTPRVAKRGLSSSVVWTMYENFVRILSEPSVFASQFIRTSSAESDDCEKKS